MTLSKGEELRLAAFVQTDDTLDAELRIKAAKLIEAYLKGEAV